MTIRSCGSCLALVALLVGPVASAQETAGGFAGFLTGGRMDIKLRTYYMDRTYEPTFAAPREEQQALAVGGWFDWETGRWHGIGFGVSLYTSQKLYGPEDKGGTNLLAPGQQGFSVLGQAWMEAKAGKTTVRLFRQKIDTPFLNFRDTKMAPFTFEAYTVENRDVPGLLAMVSYVTKIKTWTSTQFVTLGENAGFETASPLTLAGLDWKSPGKAVRLQAWNYYDAGQWNTFYAQADGTLPLGKGFSTTLSGQWIDQRGREGGAYGPFSTWMGGAMATFDWRGCEAGFAFTDTSDGYMIVNPWAGYPGFTSIMEEDNNLAAERAWLLTATVDLGIVGVPGLRVHWDRTRSHIVNPPLGMSHKDQYENDVTVDYYFRGPLEGLAIRARAAWVESALSQYSLSGRDYTDYRMILNYALPLTPLLRR